jgi:hypothetical protein
LEHVIEESDDRFSLMAQHEKDVLQEIHDQKLREKSWKISIGLGSEARR